MHERTHAQLERALIKREIEAETEAVISSLPLSLNKLHRRCPRDRFSRPI